MKEIALSERLRAVADFLPASANFADIGSDHAYLPCYVCLKDHTAVSIAGEINDGPLSSAKKTVKTLNLENRIDVRKGNGLEVIQPGEVTQLVIAGMGGSLIASILEEGKEKLKDVETLILQPNVDAKSVRKWLVENDYYLSAEKIVEESNHIYEILFAVKSVDVNSMTEKELLFGPYLLKENSKPFKKKWEREIKNTERILREMNNAKETDQLKVEKFQKDLKWMKEVTKNG